MRNLSLIQKGGENPAHFKCFRILVVLVPLFFVSIGGISFISSLLSTAEVLFLKYFFKGENIAHILPVYKSQAFCGKSEKFP